MTVRLFHTNPTSLLLALGRPETRLWLLRGRPSSTALHCNICSRYRRHRPARHRRPRTRSHTYYCESPALSDGVGCNLLFLAGVLHKIIIVRHVCGVVARL